MSGVFSKKILKRMAAASVIWAGFVGLADAQDRTPMTAGVVLDEMPTRERTSFILGVVEGLAYARFQKDTRAKGVKDETGMTCIYNWLYSDGMAKLDTIEAAFRKYDTHYPSVILSAMIKQECGE